MNEKGNVPRSFYDLECSDLCGNKLPFHLYRGQPLLIVNTASLCGFSPQFIGLEELWKKYKSEGLMVLGVPSNDFGRQEPGNGTEIVTMCSSKFGVTFPLLSKMDIKGRNPHPLFRWIGNKGGFLARPRWNFYKYIIGRDGQLQGWFSSLTPPTSARFQAAVVRSLATE